MFDLPEAWQGSFESISDQVKRIRGLAVRKRETTKDTGVNHGNNLSVLEMFLKYKFPNSDIKVTPKDSKGYTEWKKKYANNPLHCPMTAQESSILERVYSSLVHEYLQRGIQPPTFEMFLKERGYNL